MENLNANVVRVKGNYDESLRVCIKKASKNNWHVISDTSYEGYTEYPKYIMEGYTVIAEELGMNFELNHRWPTHVYLQAGVGGFAAAISYMIRLNWQVQPQIIIVEPALAPCLSVSVKKNKLQTVQGCASNMGRLDCKTPSLLAFEILQHQADKFTTITDDEAMYYVTVAQRLGFDTTPSGVAGLAALIRDSAENHYPLAIISEGNTNG
jgi:diaminopropionate ammonia-lyase